MSSIEVETGHEAAEFEAAVTGLEKHDDKANHWEALLDLALLPENGRFLIGVLPRILSIVVHDDDFHKTNREVSAVLYAALTADESSVGTFVQFLPAIMQAPETLRCVRVFILLLADKCSHPDATRALYAVLQQYETEAVAGGRLPLASHKLILNALRLLITEERLGVVADTRPDAFLTFSLWLVHSALTSDANDGLSECKAAVKFWTRLFLNRERFGVDVTAFIPCLQAVVSTVEAVEYSSESMNLCLKWAATLSSALPECPHVFLPIFLTTIRAFFDPQANITYRGDAFAKLIRVFVQLATFCTPDQAAYLLEGCSLVNFALDLYPDQEREEVTGALKVLFLLATKQPLIRVQLMTNCGHFVIMGVKAYVSEPSNPDNQEVIQALFDVLTVFAQDAKAMDVVLMKGVLDVLRLTLYSGQIALVARSVNILHALVVSRTRSRDKAVEPTLSFDLLINNLLVPVVRDFPLQHDLCVTCFSTLVLMFTNKIDESVWFDDLGENEVAWIQAGLRCAKPTDGRSQDLDVVRNVGTVLRLLNLSPTLSQDAYLEYVSVMLTCHLTYDPDQTVEEWKIKWASMCKTLAKYGANHHPGFTVPVVAAGKILQRALETHVGAYKDTPFASAIPAAVAWLMGVWNYSLKDAKALYKMALADASKTD